MDISAAPASQPASLTGDGVNNNNNNNDDGDNTNDNDKNIKHPLLKSQLCQA